MMIRDIPTKRLNTIILLSLIFLVIELLGSGAGMLIGVAILVFMMYIGWKQYDTTAGKVICWIGVIGFIIQVLSLFAVGFFIIAFLILLLLEYRRQKKNPDVITPVTAAVPARGGEEVIKGETLLPHRFLGRQTTSEEMYQWRDINIQTGVGSKVIDLSSTVIRDTAVVSIRHMIGPITILVPYDLEAQIIHSAFYGELHVFSEPPRKMLNETVSFETAGYAEAKTRVKIVTSVLSGDIEVRRI